MVLWNFIFSDGTVLLNEIKTIFLRIGFSVLHSPEIDTDFYYFEALNLHKHHPARDMHDTFYLDHTVVLRLHTSDTHIHVMKNHDTPVLIIVPGIVTRK